MIGGAMLMCAVGSMILIAWWSLPRDDEADPATGLLALRSWSGRTISREHGTMQKRNRKPAPEKRDRTPTPEKRDRRPQPGTRRRRR